MTNKKKNFLIFNTIIVAIILLVNNYTIYVLDNLMFPYLTILVIVICLFLYFFLSKSFIDDIFIIDDKLKQKIEKTMHEINTPVSTIQINSDILSSKISDTQNQKRLNKINQACDNLLKLYEDMEYYIKKEIDKVEIVSFDLKKLISHCVYKFDDLKNDIKIDVDIKSIIVTTDKNGFEAMITNLISNALKHNNTITQINIDLQDNILIFKDDGEGISTKDIYKVFDKYFQGDEKTKGFGIGLNTVKEFCDKQKIDIKINSSKEGTVFSLNLKNII